MKGFLIITFLGVVFADSCPPPSENAPMVCTYFEPAFTGFAEMEHDYSDLLKMWAESWEMQGWRTVVLREADAMKHPLLTPENLANIENLPTVNVKKYEIACYLRWFAAVQVGCEWMSDFDVINYGFPAQLPWSGPVLYSFLGFVPALVTGNRNAFEAVLDAIVKVSQNLTSAEGAKSLWMDPDGRFITSDMLILLSRPDLYVNLHFPMSIIAPYINNTVLLHFNKAEAKKWGAMHGENSLKANMIPKVRKYKK